jgi:hypothetical protein
MNKPTFLAAARCSSPHRRLATRGFSIPQLISYSAASALVVAVATSTLISSIRSNSNMELYLRAQERWSRISSLILTEASEASTVTYDESFACLGYGGNAAIPSIFKLVVPTPSNDKIQISTSTFYLKSGNGASAKLLRCGAGYNADGTLTLGQSLTLATLGLRTDLLISNQTSDSFTFTVNIYSPSNQLILSRSATATVGVEPAQNCDPAELGCYN